MKDAAFGHSPTDSELAKFSGGVAPRIIYDENGKIIEIKTCTE